MDKIKLRRKIKSFATNCVIAAAIFTMALNYTIITLFGEGMIWLLIFDIAFLAGVIFFAINDWKEIKKMLEESE